MLHQKEKCFQPRTVSLEELVPADHFYRALEAHLDLRFVYDLVKDTYAPIMGRALVALEGRPSSSYRSRSGFQSISSCLES
jgi:hypothetical protein